MSSSVPFRFRGFESTLQLMSQAQITCIFLLAQQQTLGAPEVHPKDA
jgi:hypothetical protein